MKGIIITCLALMAISWKYSYAQQPREYSEADNAIEVNAGQNFVITLESNQITGFKWQLAEPLAKDPIELVNVEYILGKARFQGAGGKEVWTFKALGAGKTTLSLKYIRPWEREPRPMKEKTFVVTVKEPTELESRTE